MDGRVETGIKGLDGALEGGFNTGSNILIKGGPGAGKTTFGLQYLVHGSRNGEKSMYMTFEESSEQIVRYGSRFFEDIQKHLEDQVLQILDFSPNKVLRSKTHMIDGEQVEIPSPDVVDSITYIEDKILDIRGNSINRVVIDGLQTFATTFFDLSGNHDVEELRRTVSKMMLLLKKENITTYILSEEPEEGKNRYDFVNYVVDGVISLKSNPSLDIRTLKIEKMRGIKHTLKPLTVEIQNNVGITVIQSGKASL